MLIGYARVSTLDQTLTLQIEALKASGYEEVYSEKKSGATVDRPEFKRMLDRVREGDAVVVWKLDRLARSVRDLRTRSRASPQRELRFGPCLSRGSIRRLLPAA